MDLVDIELRNDFERKSIQKDLPSEFSGIIIGDHVRRIVDNWRSVIASGVPGGAYLQAAYGLSFIGGE